MKKKDGDRCCSKAAAWWGSLGFRLRSGPQVFRAAILSGLGLIRIQLQEQAALHAACETGEVNKGQQMMFKMMLRLIVKGFKWLQIEENTLKERAFVGQLHPLSPIVGPAGEPATHRDLRDADDLSVLLRTEGGLLRGAQRRQT